MQQYTYLSHTADLAFEAYGKDLSELFKNAALAISNATIENLKDVKPVEIEHVQISSDSMEMLLLDFLGEIIYFKDTKHLVFSEIDVDITEEDAHPILSGTLKGEKIDQERHEIGNDVKAVTYHDYKLEKTDKGFKVYVLLDI